MPWQRVVLILGALSLLVVVWLGRYELVALPAGGEGAHGVVFRMDRWTGHMVVIGGDEAVNVKMQK